MKKLFYSGIIMVFGFTSCFQLNAQDAEAWPAPKSEDVATVDSIIEILYTVISGDKGEKRDWPRFKSLFHPDAKLIPSGPNQEGAINARFITPQEYVERSGPWLEENGFFEQEISREVQHFGNVSHVWSTYESRRTLADEKPFARGINSIQLLNDGERWWIINIYWTGEREGLVIPQEYLPGE